MPSLQHLFLHVAIAIIKCRNISSVALRSRKLDFLLSHNLRAMHDVFVLLHVLECRLLALY